MITLDPTQRKVEIRWPDGESSSYHYVWLRHNARCLQGLSNDTSIKIDLLPDDPATLSIKDFRVENDTLSIQWRDLETETSHHLPTLRQNAYDSASREKRKSNLALWHAGNADTLPVFDFTSLKQTDTVLQLHLAVRDYGIAKIKNVPTEPGTVAQVAEHFGPIHVNNYGRIFDVKTEVNVTLGSNTGAYLGPHTDEGYRHAPPGISFFHCLVASTEGGGESILVDGFQAAEKLKQTDPTSYDVLSRIPVFFQRLALPEEDMQAHGRIIATDIDGTIEGIRFTDRTIPPQDIPDEYVEPVYKGIRAFWKIVNSDEMKHVYLMQPGDLHVFDNQRVLHGRTAFDPTKSQRHLQQCSVNRDEFHNTLRVLAARQNHPASSLSMTGGALG